MALITGGPANHKPDGQWRDMSLPMVLRLEKCLAVGARWYSGPTSEGTAPEGVQSILGHESPWAKPESDSFA